MKLKLAPTVSKLCAEKHNDVIDIQLLFLYATNSSIIVYLHTLQTALAMTCNKNERQENTKSNAELHTRWKKTTWQSFEETISRGRNRSIKA